MDLPSKVRLKNIDGPFDADNEGTVEDVRGRLVQIMDGTTPFAHLVYLDFKVTDPPVYRGGHYHEKKLEVFYVITGRIEVELFDLDTGWRGMLTIAPGDKLTLLPRLAHRFRALEYAQVIEIAPVAYDPSDVFPFDFEGM
ncbi:MAG: hypothetical protein DSY91_02535 [Deltaproteobacteria bacterium]|nr:MAG: hypothetical protein DSY91_02535 [Deltaproteobacteria bacterium]